MASSDSQIDQLQLWRPKRAELPDVNINTGAQSINTYRASPLYFSLLRVEPAKRLTVRDLLEHSWFNEAKVPDIALHSPAIIADEVRHVGNLI